MLNTDFLDSQMVVLDDILLDPDIFWLGRYAKCPTAGGIFL